MTFAASRLATNAAVRLTSITRRQSVGVEFHGRHALRRAGIVDEHVEAAEGGDRLADDADDSPLVGDVEGPGPRASAGRDDFRGDGLRRGAVDVGDRDGRAGLGQGERRRAADAGARTGDERRLAVEAEEIEDTWSEGHGSPELGLRHALAMRRARQAWRRAW